MIHALALSYVVRVLTEAPADLYPPDFTKACSAHGRKPQTIAIARNGDIAIIVPDRIRFSEPNQIVLIKRVGLRETLRLPTSTILADVFHEPTGGDKGKPLFVETYFKSLTLTETGSVIATVASHFSGGFSGVEFAPFLWRSGTWVHIPSFSVLPRVAGRWEVNTEVAGAGRDGFAVFNGVYGQQILYDLSRIHDREYMLNRVELLDGRELLDLGPGTATAVSGKYVVGFSAGLNPFGPNCTDQARPRALEWLHGRRLFEGDGVLYDVNSSSNAVGDDESAFGHAGRPIARLHGRVFLLSHEKGSAFGISGDGVIVGQTVRGGFFITNSSRSTSLLMLSAVVKPRWTILAAYGVDEFGNILAVGSRRQGPLKILLLSPGKP